jgi:hypothetical protein
MTTAGTARSAAQLNASPKAKAVAVDAGGGVRGIAGGAKSRVCAFALNGENGEFEKRVLDARTSPMNVPTPRNEIAQRTLRPFMVMFLPFSMLVAGSIVCSNRTHLHNVPIYMMKRKVRAAGSCVAA